MENEVWKEVKGYEGLYEVNNYGVIRSVKRKHKSKGGKLQNCPSIKLKPIIDVYGYHTCSLSKEGKQVRVRIHRIVAQSFIPNPENKTQVNHKNGLKYDNSVENLEWNTCKENAVHSFKVLGRKSGMFGKFGKCNPNSKPIYKIDNNGNVVKRFDCLIDVKNEGYNISNVSQCAVGRIKKAHGYIWKYVYDFKLLNNE